MAAPIETDSGTSTEEDTDPGSPYFNPMRALYASNVPLPIPNVTPFNNLAEYESFMARKDAVSQRKQAGPKTEAKLSGIVAERAAAQARENVRAAALKQKMLPNSETQRRKQRSTTVFTRMEGYEKGPLSLLRRCVRERLKVLVVIRAAVSVRSHCRGFVIAFDKHMNMALMDVDEKYLKPISTENKPAEQATAERKKDKTRKEKAGKEDKGVASLTEKLMISVKAELSHKQSEVEKIGRVSQETDCHADPSKTSQNAGRSAKGADDVKLTDSESLCAKEPSKKKKNTEGKSDSTIGSVSVPEESAECEKSSSPDEAKSGHESVKSAKEVVPFWPKYQKWVSNRSYGHYEVIERHVNQLFIRGDNVVSISVDQ